MFVTSVFRISASLHAEKLTLSSKNKKENEDLDASMRSVTNIFNLAKDKINGI